MGKKITGIILIVIGSIPLIMQILRMFGGGPNMPGRGTGGSGGNFPSGGMPPSSGISPGGGIIFGILGVMNNHYVLILGVIFIVVGIILLTHKEIAIKK